jgi:tRNA pseudouridine38-40 synthase
MVRCLSYALNLCGKGLLSPEEIRSALEKPGMPRYPAMPPEGLLLWDLKTEAEFKPMIPGEKSLEFRKEEERKLAQGRKILEVIN